MILNDHLMLLWLRYENEIPAYFSPPAAGNKSSLSAKADLNNRLICSHFPLFILFLWHVINTFPGNRYPVLWMQYSRLLLSFVCATAVVFAFQFFWCGFPTAMGNPQTPAFIQTLSTQIMLWPLQNVIIWKLFLCFPLSIEIIQESVLRNQGQQL